MITTLGKISQNILHLMDGVFALGETIGVHACV